MRDRAVLREALADGNVRAFLRAIREGESRQDDDGYRIRWGGLGRPPAYFDDFGDHPRILEPTTGGRMSSAAGAYQATKTTWDEERAKWGWPDFSPGCQDEFAVARLIYRDALEDVKAGRFDAACAKCSAEWTSLPGGDEENAATRRARDTYVKWGGRFEPAAQPFDPDSLATEHYGDEIHESTVPQEDTMALPIAVELGLAALPFLKEIIPALGAAFGSGSEQQKRNVSGITAVVDVVTKATGTGNVQDAIQAMREDPAKAAAARRAVDEILPVLLEAGAGGIESARKAAGDPGQVPAWKNPAIWIAAGILPLVYMVVWAVLFDHDRRFSNDIVALVVTAIVTGALGSITGFFLGSSLGSQRKTSIIAKE